jgi:hypothetical protein
MKNPITQFAFVIIAFVALTFLMSYTRPAADEPKQYTVVSMQCSRTSSQDFEEQVNKKIAEGWHVQGGVVLVGNFWYAQAMVK